MKKKSMKLKDETKEMTIEEVYKQFERFIYKKCMRWTKIYELDDLAQTAFIGLNKAFENYEIEKGILFITYAGTIIDNELRMYHRRNKKHGNDISINITFRVKDNDQALEDMLQDSINYEDVTIKNIECEKLKLAIKKLNPGEKKIIEDLHFNYRAQGEVGKELNLSQAYISRINKRILLKLKNIMEVMV